MRNILASLIIVILCVSSGYGQFLIPGEGIMDVKIGSDWDEVEWELGFKGSKIEKSDVGSTLQFIALKAGIEYDYVVSYQHIMWLPVSDLFFKDDRIVMIQISSFPEYYKMLCADFGTVEGLNFWDDSEKVKEIYGNFDELENDGKSYIMYKEEGIGVEILDNEVRAILIFQRQME